MKSCDMFRVHHGLLDFRLCESLLPFEGIEGSQETSLLEKYAFCYYASYANENAYFPVTDSLRIPLKFL
ncbi:hypothetical protein DAMNIGENAA_07500 [Desulforhabdus amnigena]|uniref:Uncharacterized protein n=1 Tax=Desulforhabdus amnigena TaxID=40218 RepID=A0A9W6FR94_9BACT|nr:hypothetical protein DAMNIGENAA_07500 [Desulforhabdus amnigena]